MWLILEHEVHQRLIIGKVWNDVPPCLRDGEDTLPADFGRVLD